MSLSPNKKNKFFQDYHDSTKSDKYRRKIYKPFSWLIVALIIVVIVVVIYLLTAD